MEAGESGSRLHRAKEVLFQLDMFKQEVPQLNLQGKEKLSGWFGTLISLIVIGLMIVYLPIKLDILLQRNNPSISKSEVIAALDGSDKLNLGE